MKIHVINQCTIQIEKECFRLQLHMLIFWLQVSAKAWLRHVEAQLILRTSSLLALSMAKPSCRVI